MGMTIPQKKADQFWKLYDTYENARKKLGRERISLIEQYAKHYDNLTDAKAAELATKKLSCLTSANNHHRPTTE